MNSEQKQVLANYFRTMGGEITLEAALAMAAALSPGGRLRTYAFWQAIIEPDSKKEPDASAGA